MDFFDALTVVSLWIGQSEQTFLEKIAEDVTNLSHISRILWLLLLLFIPKRKCYVLQSMRIGHSGNAILSPPKSSRTSVFMRKVFQHLAIDMYRRARKGEPTAPSITVCTVVLPNYRIQCLNSGKGNFLKAYQSPTASRRHKVPISSSTLYGPCLPSGASLRC